MQCIHLFLDIFQCDTAHTAHGIGKVFIDHIRINADGLKDLRALIGLDRGNPHLGGYLHDTVQHSVIVIVHRRIIILIQHMVVDQLLDALLRQIGIDRRSAEA